VSCLDRQAPGGERPCGRCCRAAHDVEALRFGLCVVRLLLMAASWQEAHVFSRTDHNRLVDVCDNMGFLERQSRVWPAGATVVGGLRERVWCLRPRRRPRARWRLLSESRPRCCCCKGGVAFCHLDDLTGHHYHLRGSYRSQYDVSV
jgi:hypothetical protein